MSIFKEYKIFICSNCGLPQYGIEGQKTRKCPACKKTIDLYNVIIITRTHDLQKAIRVVQELKMQNKNRDSISSIFDKELKK